MALGLNGVPGSAASRRPDSRAPHQEETNNTSSQLSLLSYSLLRLPEFFPLLDRFVHFQSR